MYINISNNKPITNCLMLCQSSTFVVYKTYTCLLQVKTRAKHTTEQPESNGTDSVTRVYVTFEANFSLVGKEEDVFSTLDLRLYGVGHMVVNQLAT